MYGRCTFGIERHESSRIETIKLYAFEKLKRVTDVGYDGDGCDSHETIALKEKRFPYGHIGSLSGSRWRLPEPKNPVSGA